MGAGVSRFSDRILASLTFISTKLHIMIHFNLNLLIEVPTLYLIKPCSYATLLSRGNNVVTEFSCVNNATNRAS